MRFAPGCSTTASAYGRAASPPPPPSTGGETFLRLEGLYIGMVVAAIPCSIPQEEAALQLSQAQQGDVLPEGLKLQLRQPHVEPSALSKALNAYMSLLSESLILLRRERFYLRTKFLWVANNKLLYVPKASSAVAICQLRDMALDF